MNTVEIVLIVIGIICVIVGLILGITRNNDSEDSNSPQVSDYDSAKHISEVSQSIDSIIEQKMRDIEDKTEARLDKISNTKILEMNEYADGVLEQINRNHNEVMFMYDMLNEKDKEIKTTVKDVNITKRHTIGSQMFKEKTLQADKNVGEEQMSMVAIEDFPVDESLSKNDKIMLLYNNGYTDVDIAKRLKLGVGEVRLVLNLYVSDK